MPTPWLLLGGSGMLGRAFCELLERRGQSYTAPPPDAPDLNDLEALKRGIPEGTRVVLNCAAWTDVDGAEQKEAAATRINGDAVACMAERCKELGALLVHYSTDYVFDGQASTPYGVDQPLAPLNAYGRSKAVGERSLRGAGAEHLLLRTSWLYAPWAKNFVRTILQLGKQKSSLRVVDDQVGRPTSAESLAALSLQLVEHGARGTFHVTDGGQCSWYDFAREILSLGKSSCQVEPCNSAEYPRPAKRPAYSVLDISRTEALLGPLPSWRENLASVIARVEA